MGEKQRQICVKSALPQLYENLPPTPVLTTLTGWPISAPTTAAPTFCTAASTFECAITGSLTINQISATTPTPAKTTVFTGAPILAAGLADATGFFTVGVTTVNTCTDWTVGAVNTATLSYLNNATSTGTWSDYASSAASKCISAYASFLCIETDS